MSLRHRAKRVLPKATWRGFFIGIVGLVIFITVAVAVSTYYDVESDVVAVSLASKLLYSDGELVRVAFEENPNILEFKHFNCTMTHLEKTEKGWAVVAQYNKDREIKSLEMWELVMNGDTVFKDITTIFYTVPEGFEAVRFELGVVSDEVIENLTTLTTKTFVYVQLTGSTKQRKKVDSIIDTREFDLVYS